MDLKKTHLIQYIFSTNSRFYDFSEEINLLIASNPIGSSCFWIRSLIASSVACLTIIYNCKKICNCKGHPWQVLLSKQTYTIIDCIKILFFLKMNWTIITSMKFILFLDRLYSPARKIIVASYQFTRTKMIGSPLHRIHITIYVIFQQKYTK